MSDFPSADPHCVLCQLSKCIHDTRRDESETTLTEKQRNSAWVEARRTQLRIMTPDSGPNRKEQNTACFLSPETANELLHRPGRSFCRLLCLSIIPSLAFNTTYEVTVTASPQSKTQGERDIPLAFLLSLPLARRTGNGVQGSSGNRSESKGRVKSKPL
jgi:hypothetical protein